MAYPVRVHVLEKIVCFAKHSQFVESTVIYILIYYDGIGHAWNIAAETKMCILGRIAIVPAYPIRKNENLKF